MSLKFEVSRNSGSPRKSGLDSEVAEFQKIAVAKTHTYLEYNDQFAVMSRG